MSEPVKPCPFCGAAPEYHETADSVICRTPNCLWESYADFHGVELALWNRRTYFVGSRSGKSVPPEAGRAPLSPEIREALEVALAALAVARSDTDFVREEAAATLRSFLSVSTEGLK